MLCDASFVEEARCGTQCWVGCAVLRVQHGGPKHSDAKHSSAIQRTLGVALADPDRAAVQRTLGVARCAAPDSDPHHCGNDCDYRYAKN